jgi:predicted ATPase with chaperone activity
MAACAYTGSAPVPLSDYIVSVDAQTVRAEAPRREQLEKAFSDIHVEPDMFDALGPALNSGAGLFLYGAPGNGKTTLAKRMTACYGASIWIPRTLYDDGQLVKLFDAAFHEPVRESEGALLKHADHDRRWVKIVRPTVIVGGELTMDALEIKHDLTSNVSEAPIQLKSNCGCLLIDDFGRQRIEPQELLNRWIVPLENKVDYLTLANGKKIQVPFEQLIIFSTNLEPAKLADDAFLRRIPYKIEVGDPGDKEFQLLFSIMARSFGCRYDAAAVDYLITTHYRPNNRPLRRCQPRDLLLQIRNYCVYNDLPIEMLPEHFDRVVKSYFTVVTGR